MFEDSKDIDHLPSNNAEHPVCSKFEFDCSVEMLQILPIDQTKLEPFKRANIVEIFNIIFIDLYVHQPLILTT